METTFAEIIRLLRNAFGIRDGELERAGLMQVNIFLIISTLLIVKPTVNGLFLSEFGAEQLPNAFILVAIAAAVVSTIYSRLLSRIPLRKIMAGTTVYSVLSLILFGIFLKYNIFDEVVLYLFYIWVAIFALLATSQFWVLANLVFNAREAKRLFGFIGAGAIGGGILGGYLTSVLANITSSENLLFVAAGSLAICIPVSKRIWDRFVPEKQSTFLQKKQLHGTAEHPLNLIRQSRHLSFLAGIVGVSVMVAKLVDYQFSDVASSLITDRNELTAFFGFWFSTFNLISLLLQLFLTRRIVGTFGVGVSLFFLPSLILGAALLLLVFPELLLAAIFLKMADGSLKQSINKAAMELIILPIPVDIKNRTKTFIDVFVDSLATGISGIILIFFIKGLELPSFAISLMTIGLIFLWIFLADRVRREYLQTFKLKLDIEREDNTPIKRSIDLSSDSAIGGLKRVLGKGTEKQILFVLEKIRELHDERFFEPVRELLSHSSEEVRAAAVSTLYFYQRYHINETIEPLIHDPSQKVKIQAFEYLLTHAPNERMRLINQYLRDDDYRVRGAALVSLARDNQYNERMKAAFALEKRIRQRLQELPMMQGPRERFEKITVAKAIGYANIPVLHEYLFHFLSDADDEVVRNAIIAAGETLSPIFIDKLVRFLSLEQFRKHAQQALVHYDKAIIPELANIIAMPAIPVESVRAIPAVVRSIASQQSVNFLFELVDHEDPVVRQEALRGLNILRETHKHLHFDKKDIVRRILIETRLFQDTLSILHAQSKQSLAATDRDAGAAIRQGEARHSLIRLLEQRLDRNLERIFRLLGLRYPSDDILVIYKSLRSDKEDLRVNALEFLDNLLEPNLKKVIIPIIESAMLETISERAVKNLNLKIPDEYVCFKKLLNTQDIRLKIAVLYLIGQLGDPKFMPLVEESVESGQGRVRDFARKVMSRT